MAGKKGNIFKRIFKFFKEVGVELKKVTWPTKKQMLKSTLIVLVFLLIIGLLIFGLDLLFSWLFTLIQ